MRSLCHSRGVTADYLQFQERFKMKKAHDGTEREIESTMEIREMAGYSAGILPVLIPLYFDKKDLE